MTTSSTQIGSITVTATVDSNGNATYTGTFPSGKVLPISQATLDNITDPAYVSAQSGRLVSTLTDPSDIAAAQSFYAAAPGSLPSFEQSVTSSSGNAATATPPTTGAAGGGAAPGNNSSSLQGAADSDSGAPQSSAPGTTPKSPAAAAGSGGTTDSTATNDAKSPPPSKPEGSNSSTIPATPSGYQFQASRFSTQSVAPVSQPGRRLRNPLGEFLTYTYQLSLYMITPDAYEAFVASGRTKINAFNDLTAGTGAGGAFLIAQSGGINNTVDKRMPGFDFDYGIDNLQITQAINTKATQDSNVSSYAFSFQVTEPYGFSFITNIKNANAIIAQYMGGKSNVPENGAKQFFILGIRFFGYNTAGVPAKPTDQMAYSAGPSGTSGAIDPLSQSGALFEHFYDLTLTSIKFKLDGKMTVYSIEAVNSGSQAGFSVKRGMVNYDTPITGTTVAEILDKLMVKMNNEQVTLADQQKITTPNQYEIVWAPGTQPIMDATIISPADKDKSKSPGSGAKSTKEVTAASEIKHQTAATGVAQSITFNHDTSILAAINQVIAQSSYLEDALKVVYTTSLQSPASTKAPPEVDNAQQKKVSWYSCSAQIKKIDWDNTVNDWAYTISYVIQKYETPIVDSSVVKSGQYYPGPHKRYDYWYTGENTEILHYEQSFDNLFFNVALNPSEGSSDGTGGSNPPASQPNTSTGKNAASNPTNTAIVPGKFTSQPRLGKTGFGMEAQNNYTTSLYDPGSFAEANIAVLGDPDYLMQEPTYSESILYDKVYGPNGYSINPGGGQVFIEIDFKEAVDYENLTGTLRINESIQFWKYPENISKKIKGVSYMLTECVSKFRAGSFTQDLKAVINAFKDPGTGNAAAADSGRPAAQTTPNATAPGNPPGNSNQSSGSQGTKVDPSFNAKNATSPNANTSNQTPASGTTPSGPGAQPVANDDAKAGG